MIKSLVAGALAISAVGSPASAYVYASSPSITLGDATDIRRCPIGTDVTRGVCYNQTREYSISLWVAKPIKWSTNRAYSIDCEQRAFSTKTLKGSVARKYCPVRGSLPTMYTL